MVLFDVHDRSHIPAVCLIHKPHHKFDQANMLPQELSDYQNYVSKYAVNHLFCHIKGCNSC